jgi:hypothetical protein
MDHADAPKLLVKILGEMRELNRETRETNRLLRLVVGEREPEKMVKKSEGGVAAVHFHPDGSRTSTDAADVPSQLTDEKKMLADANPQAAKRADVVAEAARVLRLSPDQLRAFGR